MVFAEEPSRSRLDECFLTGRYQVPHQRSSPFFPEVRTSSRYSGMPPLVSHTSLCFSCSNICWRCWIKGIRAPASSGWVCGHTSLLAHSYRIEGKAEPSIQAVQSYICTRWTHLLGGWTSGFSAAHYGCALGLSGQDARQWGSRSGCSFTQGPEECDRPGSTHPKHLGTPCVSTLRQQVQQVINKSPELVSKRLCMLENDLLVWAQNNLHSLKATHVPGKMNQGADMLSRNNVFSEEWTLHPLAFQRIWEGFGRARVDLFASEDNSHCSIFFTKSTEALAHGWPSLPLYAFPPVALLPQVLRRVREQRHKLILIAPLWRNQLWVSAVEKQPRGRSPWNGTSSLRFCRLWASCISIGSLATAVHLFVF